MILLGPDRFKLINDGLGHSAGDQLLHLAGQRFTGCLDAGDTLARIGGDEFAVLVENPAGRENGEELARRFLDALKEPFALDGQEVFITASGGIAYSAPDRADADRLLRDAGVALHHAKAQGKQTAALFDLSMDPYAAERVGVETDLRRALERDELFLQYQPEVDLATGAVVGVEALIRWQHPKRGLIPPDDFIPVAEDSGLIVEIGRWVIETACAQAGRWIENHPDREFTVSVNLSPRQFQDPSIFDQIARVLQQTGLPAERLKLEITESTLIENIQSAIARLDALTAMGIRLAIDDFGTGYSSYGYLRELSIDTLKIDRTFVTPLPDDRRNLEIIRSITVLANALEMDVTVEGVETVDQRDAVMDAGCRRAQGFLFERPVDVEIIDELLMSGLTLLPAELRPAA